MHGWKSHARTQHKKATTRVHKRLKLARDTTQDVKGNVYVQLTWTASSRKEERVAAYGITNGGGNGAMESSKASGWRSLFSAANHVLPPKLPFPKQPRSHFSSLTLRPFHTSYGRPVQIGSTEAPANL